MATFIIFLIIAAGVVYGLVRMRRNAKSGCCSPTDAVEKIKPQDTNVEDYPYTTTLHVNDMHCDNCATKVENAFNKNSAYYAKVNLSKKIVTIHSKQKEDTKKYITMIARAGYTATV